MTIINDTLNIDTHGGGDMVDITDQLTRMLQRHKLKQGQVLVFVPGSTAGVTTIEYEPGLKKDFSVFMERIIPKNVHYYHEETWNDGNGHSHIRSSLLGPSLVIPVGQSRLLLGTWQQVVVVDFDNRPRSRDLVVQFCGE
jgi:secondary thiamine-phosphate synthase enzyme